MKKISVVDFTNAIIEPSAVMIKAIYTSVA
jgi:hypothetical protein